MSEFTEIGVVILTAGKTAKVQMRRKGACSSEHQGCVWNALLENMSTSDFTIEAENTLVAVPGDMVEVRISPNKFFQALFFIYIFPLISVFGGYFLGKKLSGLFGLDETNLFTIFFTLFGLVIWFISVKKFSNNYNAGYKIVRVRERELVNCLQQNWQICS